MKLVTPRQILDANLVSASIAETDYAAWSAGTTYAAGNRAIKTATHRIYESVAGGNVGNDPATVGTTAWLDVGPTNRWAMFVATMGARSTAAGTITFTLSPGTAVAAIGFVDVSAASIRVQVTATGVPAYDVTSDVSARASLSLVDLPIGASQQIVVTVAPTGGSAAIGKVVIGDITDLGDTESAPTIGIIDFSRRETDVFGVTTVVERAWAKRLTARTRLASSAVDGVQRATAAVRAKPALWIGETGFESLTLYGFYKEFSAALQLGDTTFCSLTIEGLPTTGIAAGGSDPAVSGTSDFVVIPPVVMTDAILTSSSVAETDYAAWSSVATYALGARVIKTATHRAYENLIGGNVGHDPATDPTRWLDVGPTNRWAMFDTTLGTRTSALTSIAVTVTTPIAVSGLALLDVGAATVRVQSGAYDQTQAAVVGGVAREVISFLDLTVAAGATITITIAASGTGVLASVGTLLFGGLVPLGVMETSPTIGIIDFSQKATDDFGNTNAVERAWAKRLAGRSLVATSAVERLLQRVATLRATPALWIANQGLDSLGIYGFFRDVSFELAESVSTCSVTIEGLSKAPQLLDTLGEIEDLQTRLIAAEEDIVAAGSNNVLSAGSEKQQAVIDYTALTAQSTVLLTKYASLGNPTDIATAMSTMTTEITALATYLATISPAWNDQTVDSVIVAATWGTKWQAAINAASAAAASLGTHAAWSGVANDNGKLPSDGATADLNLTALTNGGSSAPSIIGNAVLWNAAGAVSWGQGALGRQAALGAASVSAVISVNSGLMVGLTTKASPTADYTLIDYTLYGAATVFQVYRNGGYNTPNVNSSLVPAVGDVLTVVSDDVTVFYLVNRTLIHKHAVDAQGQTVRPMVSLAGGSVASVTFVPGMSNDFAKQGGPTKPADNATKNTTTYSGSAPSSPTDGDIWVDTSTSPSTTKLRVSGAWQVAATKNTTTYSSSAPASPTNGDIWVDTTSSPYIFKLRDAGAWVAASNYVTNTNQVTDGANLGGTATWTGVSGAGKPADNATKNTTTYSGSAPGSPTDGDIWVDTSTSPSTTKLRVAGAWQIAATKNTTTYSASAPTSPTNGDIWVDTSSSPYIFKLRDAGVWVAASNYVTNTNQVTDGANLGGTAIWTGVTGTGKPSDNAGTSLTLKTASASPIFSGNKITGQGGWATFYSSETARGGAWLSFTADTASFYAIIGLSDSIPSTATDPTGYNSGQFFGLNFTAGTLYSLTVAGNSTSLGSVAAGDHYDLLIDNITCRIYKGGALVDTLAVPSGTIWRLRGQIYNGSLSGVQFGAATDNRTYDSTGAVVADGNLLNTNVGVGQNAFTDSGFARGTAFLAPAASAGCVSFGLFLNLPAWYGKRQVAYGHCTSIPNGDSFDISQLGIWGSPGSVALMQRYALPVKQGDRVGVRALVGNHRCEPVLYLLVFDKDGGLVGAPATATGSISGGGSYGDNLGTMQNIYDVTSSTAAYAVWMIRAQNTSGSAYTDSYLFFSEPWIGKLAAGQAVLPIYSPGPADIVADQTALNQASATATVITKSIAFDYTGTTTTALPAPVLAPKVVLGGTDITTSDRTTYVVQNLAGGCVGKVTVDNTAGSTSKGSQTIATGFNANGSYELAVSVDGKLIAIIKLTVVKVNGEAPAGGGGSTSGQFSSSGYSNATTSYTEIGRVSGLTVASGKTIRAYFDDGYDMTTSVAGTSTRTETVRWAYSVAGANSWTVMTTPVSSVTGSACSFTKATNDQSSGAVTCNQTAAPSAGNYDVKCEAQISAAITGGTLTNTGTTATVVVS